VTGLTWPATSPRPPVSRQTHGDGEAQRAVTLACWRAAIARCPPPPGWPGGPDRGFRTPIAHGAASAHSSISAQKLSTGLRKLFRRRRQERRVRARCEQQPGALLPQGRAARILASNSKLFTTSTALARFEPQNRLHTTAWSIDDISDGISQGLYVRGGGDPT
jgi:hypothetical protein